MTTDAPASPPDDDRWPADLRFRVFAVLVGSLMPLLESSISHVALRSLAAGLRMPLTTAQWTMTAYLLAFAAVVPVSMWAMHRFGAERTYLAALGVYTLASALCGTADAPWQLIVARAAQGVGGGLIGSVSRMMLATAAGPRRLPRVMAAFGVPVMLVSVAGPLVGGWLLANEGWRSVFFVDIPIGLLAMVLVRRLVRPVPPAPRRALDVVGLLLVSPGLVGVTYGVSEAGEAATLDSPTVVVPLFTGAALIASFVLWSIRDRRPLLDLRLYRNAAFRAAAQSTLVTGAVVFGGTILLPLYLQTVRGESALRTGLLIAPQGIGVAASTWLSGRLFERIGGATVLAGSALLLASTLPPLFLTQTTPYGWLIGAATIRGIGVGLAMTPAMTAAFQVLAPAQIGEASTQFNALQHVGGSLGTALIVVVLDQAPRAGGQAAGGQALAERAHAFATAYWILLALSMLSLMPAAALARIRRRERRRPPLLRDPARHAA